MIIIDNQQFDVGVVNIKRKADFLDSEATQRLENGDMYRDLIGVYFNYDIKFEPCTPENYEDYMNLWEKLTEPVEFHDVIVPYNNTTLAFRAYFSNVADEMMLKYKEKNYWKNLTVNFKSKAPAKR